MSEERGKREDESGDSSTPDSSTPDASVSQNDTSSAAVAKPSGKRTARRSRTAGAASEPVSISKSSDGKSTAPAGKASVATRTPKSREAKRPNIFKRLIQFLREVVAELRKVIWPNRKQMVTYTSVVLVFVAFMVAYISGLDLAFTQGVEWLFG
ncbi:preprotein translocase subunit SecE [Rhodococcus sp. RS1C4]|uniref:preprotein translocase subunit SecE n=1 Tax=Nocardiaceae TaxID=85025 RepID=UPI00036697E1|nr:MULTISPECIES: preprotein translocase subunit SecE [Rhodococcus]OZC51285.1 preprotein translocase subunit SecE [Rhodococcus sp. RS1C4]OZD10761.1 preprotein translocase subunit SecE [Rhodococcus sp. 06-156-4C]OZD23223.1 preprotein translocase subunit SecE [Rhodococcus sp. 06-156-3C]OZD28044.1 preprotein translocase subunit SecE [Rhodococcus sp. 06-156-4a]OZD28694.1 preprotein translocase subunit SecE [Rhodococcus sp. 06-156-3b]